MAQERRFEESAYALSIWSTDGCNLRCAYCFYDDESYKNFRFMDEETAKATIDFIERTPIQSLSFFGGEPLLNWKIIELILNGIKKKIPSSVTTNGILLDEGKLKYLKGHNTHINLSLDGTPETQNKWRDNSYEKILSNMEHLIKYENLTILKTLVEPHKLYEDICHIRDLGFKNVFINLLDPFSSTIYKLGDLHIFKENYKKVINIHNKGININDFERWRDLIKKGTRPGCGFTGLGLGEAPDGKLYTCHQGPSMPEEFSFGDVWSGIDKEKEHQIRKMAETPKSCMGCVYGFNKCPVTMWNHHKKFGVEAPDWYKIYEITKIMLIEEACGLERKLPLCQMQKIV